MCISVQGCVGHPEGSVRFGSCQRCGRPMEEPPTRDPNVERRFMADVAELVGLMRGMSFNPGALDAYLRTVHERLQFGDREFGTQFLRQDNLLAAQEEGPDISAYGLLEVERLQREGVDDEVLQEVRSALVTAAAYAAIADEHVRQARYLLVAA